MIGILDLHQNKFHENYHPNKMVIDLGTIEFFTVCTKLAAILYSKDLTTAKVTSSKSYL